MFKVIEYDAKGSMLEGRCTEPGILDQECRWAWFTNDLEEIKRVHEIHMEHVHQPAEESRV